MKIAKRLAVLVASAVAASRAPAQPAADPDGILTSGKALCSQGNEELIIRHFFQDRREGFFVDVGSWHWRNLSTTYYLEHHLGWSGIAIDALPGLAEDYRRHRPRTRFFQYIVTDHSGTVESFYVAGPLSSTAKDWAKALAKRPVVPQEIKVPTITMTELLDRNGVKKIDFVSMDIEGGELAALAGFDIARFKPELLCVETGGILREGTRRWFADHGYEEIERYHEHDPVNLYFRPRRETRGPRSGARRGTPERR
jgi:FkbM family methyltransferase